MLSVTLKGRRSALKCAYKRLGDSSEINDQIMQANADRPLPVVVFVQWPLNCCSLLLSQKKNTLSNFALSRTNVMINGLPEYFITTLRFYLFGFHFLSLAY